MPSAEDPRAAVLITPAELREVLSTRPPVLLDVRWSLHQPDGSAAFAQAHIPSARYVSMDTELSAAAPATNDAEWGPNHPFTHEPMGRHPLPDPRVFEQRLSAWGITQDTDVVVYDDLAGQAAARAWWLLRWVGYARVRVLDGGLSAWVAQRYPTTQSDPTQHVTEPELGTEPEAGPESFVPAMPTLSADDVSILAQGQGVVLDARAPERYAGTHEPMDARAGHIPGALNSPTGVNLSEGVFRPAGELAEHYASLGIGKDTPVGVYCGSGITACHTALALSSIGITPAIFAPSWSGWSADPNRSAATGTQPG